MYVLKVFLLKDISGISEKLSCVYEYVGTYKAYQTSIRILSNFHIPGIWKVYTRYIILNFHMKDIPDISDKFSYVYVSYVLARWNKRQTLAASGEFGKVFERFVCREKHDRKRLALREFLRALKLMKARDDLQFLWGGGGLFSLTAVQSMTKVSSWQSGRMYGNL